MASKQALVIGLGQFGSAVAESLTRRGVEVLAADRDPDVVKAVAPLVAEAVTFDALDEAALARAAPARRDICVCAIGEAREASIICTALLRQMGARMLVARAVDTLHERILRLVGAHEVVNPERAFGERYVTHLVYEGLIQQVALGEDLVLSELRVPPVMVGRSLAELRLPQRYKVVVAAVRRSRAGAPEVIIPGATDPLREEDVLVLVGRPGAAERLARREGAR